MSDSGQFMAEYASLKEQKDRIEADLQQLGKRFQHLANALLRQPHMLQIAGDKGFISVEALPSMPSVDPEQVPTVDEIRRLVSRLVDVRSQIARTVHGMPADQRKALGI